MPSDNDDDVKPPARSGPSALANVDLSLSLYERVKSRHQTVSMPKPVPSRHYGRALGGRRAISDDELVANGDSEEVRAVARKYVLGA
jgi:hypothetical protein